MAGRKSDFTLTKLDDLFTTQAQRDEEQLSKIRDIPLELIDDFPDHPFKVRDDEDMMQLVESVKERGVITPATVRQKEDGRYELVSGHRRKRACELAGFETLRSEIVDLNRDEATILMVESNFQRSEILPSEKAFAYKMRLEAMKRQGQRTDLTSTPLVEKLAGKDALSVSRIGEEVGESREQIRRYIRLTNLVPELLEFVDEGRIKMRPAVELSYLDEDCQRDVVDERQNIPPMLRKIPQRNMLPIKSKRQRIGLFTKLHTVRIKSADGVCVKQGRIIRKPKRELRISRPSVQRNSFRNNRSILSENRSSELWSVRRKQLSSRIHWLP